MTTKMRFDLQFLFFFLPILDNIQPGCLFLSKEVKPSPDRKMNKTSNI